MKLILSLLLIIGLINLINCQSLLSIKNFNYDIIGCNNKHSSDSQSTTGSSSSFGNDEKDIGTVDGTPGSQSSFAALCDNVEIINQNYVKLDVCAGISKYGSNVFTTFSLNYDTGKIIKTEYNQQDCTGQGTVEDIQLYQCNDDCKTNPFIYSIVEFKDIVLPKNTFLRVNTDCSNSTFNDDWKKTFTSIQYTPINQCQTIGGASSQQASCNASSVAISYANRYNCLEFEVTEYFNTGFGGCNGDQIYSGEFLICNI